MFPSNGKSPEQVCTKLSRENKAPRELLNKKNHRVWGEPQCETFQEIKQVLISSPVLALFDPNCETVVSADASSCGLRAMLLQKQPDEQLPISPDSSLQPSNVMLK